QMRLRYTGTCILCGQVLERGSLALYSRNAKTVRCNECKPSPSARAIDIGKAGNSAHREYERRRASREARVKSQLGNVIGGFALAVGGEPQSMRAWEQGLTGEKRLAEALAGIGDVTVLHDRRVPGTRGNIDHIVIAPSGVFVIDAKLYTGLIQVRNRGGL